MSDFEWLERHLKDHYGAGTIVGKMMAVVKTAETYIQSYQAWECNHCGNERGPLEQALTTLQAAKEEL